MQLLQFFDNLFRAFCLGLFDVLKGVLEAPGPILSHFGHFWTFVDFCICRNFLDISGVCPFCYFVRIFLSGLVVVGRRVLLKARGSGCPQRRFQRARA